MMTQYDEMADVVVTSLLMGRPMFAGVNQLSLEHAFTVADKVCERIERPLAGLGGYKIAWNTDSQMQAFDLPHPGMGRVFNKHIRADGAQIALADFAQFMLEAEIVAYLGEDLTPGVEHTGESVRDAVAGFSVGFEILNRLDGAAEASVHAMVAHNVFNAGAVVGDIRIPARELDPSKITTRLAHNGSMVFEGLGKAPQDPFEAIAFLANHFTGRGYTMQAGQMILCGSHIPLYAVNEPGEFSLSMSALGEVAFSVV